MLNRRFLFAVVALGLVGGFILGLAHLFRLRFERGDVFPPYSSLRTDPVGTKALHDALDALSGMEVRRNYQPIAKLGDGPDSTILILGVSGFENWNRVQMDQLKLLAAAGNRVVITMRAETKKPGKRREGEDDSDGEEEEVQTVDDRGIGTVMTYLPGEGRRTALSASPGLPPEISWHSVVGFAQSDRGWRYLYRVNEWPVLMERKFGDGSIVLATDSYFLSNEALRDERHSDLVAWLVGRHANVVFDEFHNGLTEGTGVMSLVRKYRLRPLAFALLLIAGLYLWKNAVPFVPHRAAVEESGLVLGKDSAEGFVNLLRRSVPPRSLLATCVGQWKTAFARRQAERVAEVDAVLAEMEAEPAKRRDPVEGYRRIARLLEARKKGKL